MPVTVIEAQARMQAKLAELARSGVGRVLLYGAGRHTLKVGEVLGASPVEIVGIIDDRRGGRGERLWNWPILSPDQAAASGAQAVVISSDGIEQQIWETRGQWLIGQGLAVHRLYGTGSEAGGEPAGEFIDSTGKRFECIPGYRRQVKPGWEELLAWRPGDFPTPTLDDARAGMRDGLKRAALLEKYLQLSGFTLRDRDILEIGCWDGACCFALALAGCRRAVGIDYQDYFLWNVDREQITEPLRDAARKSLQDAQSIARRAAAEAGFNESLHASRVELLVDDINDCRLPSGAFDLICSWQTLEHVIPPEKTFAAMGRLLRPGGLCFCEYGAFTNRKGGHGLCTLDFPWGHLRLSPPDMDRYLRQFRPDEYEHAIRHYHHFLNRLTLAVVPELARNAGLVLLDRMVWLNRQQFEEELQPDVLHDARRHYPSLTVADLIHDDIWMLLQKPG